VAAKKGNQLWKLRQSHGRPLDYPTPEDLRKGCEGYFEWVEKNPLKSAESVKFQGSGKLMMIPKMRAMTQAGLCLHLGISQKTWGNYANRGEDFLQVTTWAEAVMFEQKFSGAAADMLNANLIARELGLADKQSITGKDDGPLQIDATISPSDKLRSMVKQIAERS
jgi:hypothetical protein